MAKYKYLISQNTHPFEQALLLNNRSMRQNQEETRMFWCFSDKKVSMAVLPLW